MQAGDNFCADVTGSVSLGAMSPDSHWLLPPLRAGITPGLRDALGPLGEVADDPRVSDVFLTSEGRVFVDTGEGAYRVNGVHLAPDHARDIARGLIERGGRHVDEANPLVDVNLGGGVRVHVVLPPIARLGPEISLRIHRHQKPQLDQLAMKDADHVIPFLIRAVRNKKTLLISGATGSGKTTLLGAAMAHAAPSERLVVLEDLAELSIDHPHVVALECRQANVEGAGEVTLSRLVKEALRMRPDRLIVGECRGAELADLLRAFHTGHRGGATTLHATSLEDIPLRLDSLASLAGLGSRQVALHTASAIDLFLHLSRTDDGSRAISVGKPVLDKKGVLRVVVEEMAQTRRS